MTLAYIESPTRAVATMRPSVAGKFLAVGGEKFYVRGVTYGTFRPDEQEDQYPSPEVVALDFAGMVAAGVNAVRVYTVPPTWLLDAAGTQGLRVMVGLPWEQHIAFLDDPGRANSIEERVRDGVRRCAGHPAVLCYAVGNEIPAAIVRWHGHQRVEHFLKRLCQVVRREDPGALVTYVNFPSTEYLDLPFVDFLSFNVYLESRDKFEAYFARLQNLAGDRPLVLAEVGLDSRRNGESAQSSALDWQVRSAFAAGCAGAFVFAWTDEWYRGGHEIKDWDFGLTDRERRPKPALDAVRRAFAEVPFPRDRAWPRVSVVVCSHNGSRTIADCLDALARLDSPNFEVIVVDDGSTDATAEIAMRYDVRVIRTVNRGLSSARNTGMAAATGEIIAYIDDDALPDPHWLRYLADAFMRTRHAAIGGPNIPPPGDGPVADCVANAPGGPVHVLLDDQEAEHVPGCNLAVRKDCLEAIGGFDPLFRVAGDDVDMCWRLQERGWTLGFSPAAMVWHHRRNSVRAYWKQQQGYGRAEAMLERKWPDKYNSAGHVAWAGRLYGNGVTRALGLSRGRIYQGVWGSAPFQSIYEPGPGLFRSLPLMPEWYLLIAVLAAIAACGVIWAPMLAALPLLIGAVSISLIQAGLNARRVAFVASSGSRADQLKLYALTSMLHVIQPLARLRGRLRFGLTPWRQRGRSALVPLWPTTTALWSELWRSPEDRVLAIESTLQGAGAIVARGADFDRWDLQIRGGILADARVILAVEDHGSGRQLIRLRSWPKPSVAALAVVGILALLFIAAMLNQNWGPAVLIGALILLLTAGIMRHCGAALVAIRDAIAKSIDRD